MNGYLIAENYMMLSVAEREREREREREKEREREREKPPLHDWNTAHMT